MKDDKAYLKKILLKLLILMPTHILNETSRGRSIMIFNFSESMYVKRKIELQPLSVIYLSQMQLFDIYIVYAVAFYVALMK